MTVDLEVLRGLPQGWASDVEILARTGSVVADHGDHLVVGTPANPGYRWGNAVVVRAADRVDDATAWTDRFRHAFPEADHVSIGLPGRPDPSVWVRAGLRVESDEVLVAARPPLARPPAAGYAFRRLTTASDWAAAVELEVRDEGETHGPGGPDAAAAPGALAGYRTFAARRWSTRAQASEAGQAAFFGSFRDGVLVACLGIVRCSDHARYQSVLTDRHHREHGLAGHLLEVAGAWAGDRGATRWVILVEPDSPAARLYRRVGFGFDSLTWQASAV